MAQAASKTCEMCMSAAGSQYCLDCEEYYCENSIAQLRGENETRINSKRDEANQNMKKIEQNLIWFDNAVESVIKAITDESTMIKRMIDKSVAEMISLVKEQSEKEKKLIKMMSDAESVLDAGLKLDKERLELDKIKQDKTMIQKIKHLQEEINKLQIDYLTEFPYIFYNRKSVTEDEIRQLIGTYTIR
ncbi:unnamed protein product [Mytilus coruscus]|uniref:B box-type domain-containing protein n=1 Tax=Mytilus coruscus TaxID=42192 RepID=A0A6J8AE13_MYTCO|nr:unnamed protein product [Mytilus coruscus]